MAAPRLRKLSLTIVAAFVAAAGTLSTAPWRAVASATTSPQTPATVPTQVAHAQLVFEENVGQTDGQVAFFTHAANATVFLARDRMVFDVASPMRPSSMATLGRLGKGSPRGASTPAATERAAVSMVFVGANPTPTIVGLDQQQGTVNYFIGRDPSQWHRDVATFARVEYKDLYPGIDLVFYGGSAGPEHDWIVHPGADPGRIHLRIDGARSIDATGGALHLTTPVGTVTQTAPVAFQGGARTQSVTASYAISKTGDVSFVLGRRDPTATLTIDPALVFSTFVGGNSGYLTDIYGVTVDSSGNVLLTGRTDVYDYPIANAQQSTLNGQENVVITKMSPDGTKLLYSTFFGGSHDDGGTAITTDSSGNAYVGGYTSSTDFPIANAFQTTCAGGAFGQFVGCMDGFVAKFTSAGQIVFSTYLGGSHNDSVTAVAMNPNGNVDVAGYLGSTDFPVVNAWQPSCTTPLNTTFCDAGFLAEFKPNGNVVYSTYFNQAGGNEGIALAEDASGALYVTGEASPSGQIATSGAAQPVCGTNPTIGGCYNGFVAKIAPGATSVVYATYLGGLDSQNSGDFGTGIAVDNNGDAFVTGSTPSSNFPTTAGVVQPSCGGAGPNNTSGTGCADGFVTEVNPAGSQFVYSTFLGGSNDDFPNAIGIDSSGNAYVTGVTYSHDFPMKNPLWKACAGYQSYSSYAYCLAPFVTRLSTGGTKLDYSTFLGSEGFGYAIYVKPSGNAYVAGQTQTSAFLSASALQSSGPSPSVAWGYVAEIQAQGSQAALRGGPVTRFENSNWNGCWACYVLERQALQGLWGDPVDGATGALTETRTDLSVAETGLPLAFARTYSSVMSSTNGALGYGWTFGEGALLAVDSVSGNVTVTQENGNQAVFVPSGGGYAASAPRLMATLAHNSDGTWTFARQQSRDQLTFSSAGQLTRHTDRNGYSLTLAYNSSGQLITITDFAGRALTLAYTGSHLTSVSDPISRKVTFGYNDGAGNLTDVTDVDGGTTHMTYDPNHLLLTVTDPRGGKVTNTYDTSQRVIAQADQLNRATTFGYSGDPTSATGSTTTITDPKGNVTVEQYTYGLRTAITRGFGTPQAATWTYTYDPSSAGLIIETDPNGNQTHRAFDLSGNLRMKEDGLDRYTVNAYDSSNNLTSTTDPNGVQTTFQYDPNGNLLKRSTGSEVTSFAYTDAAHSGAVTAMTDPNGNTWHSTYDANGDLASSADPLGDTTTYTYNAVGWRLSAVSPKGNVSGCNCAAQYTTSYSYTDPQTGALDGFGDVRTITDPLGHVTTRSYDANRNLAAETDPNGHTTQFSYDLANELTTTTRADGTSLKTDHWPDGTVKDQVDGLGHITSYGYDALGRRASVTTPPTAQCSSGCTTTFSYDGAGNMVSRTDPGDPAAAGVAVQNLVTTYGYDAARELTSITYSDGATPNVTGISYDGDGNRTQMSDGTGTTSFTYDSLGRLTNETDGTGNQVNYSYDLDSHVTGLTYPNGRTITRGYDTAGRLTSITDWLNNKTTFTPDADSNVTATVYPNGTTASQTWDAADRVKSISDAPTSTPNSPFASFTYTRDTDGQVASVASTGVPTDNNTYGYTRLNQLSQVNSSTYAYDAGDNATQLLNGSVQTFDAADELVGGTAGGGITYAYNPRGDRTTETPTTGSPTTLAYDQASRLTGFGTSATYGYNADGLRTSKTVGGVAQHFAWDTSGSLPVLLSDGRSNYINGPNGTPIEQVPSPSLVGRASAGDSTSLSLTVPLPPATAPNDQIIVAATQTADHPAPTINGYSLVGTVQSGGVTSTTTAEMVVYRKTATATDSQVAVNFAGPTPFPKDVVVAVYQGVDPTNPIDGSPSSAGASQATSVTAPSITTTAAADQLVMVQGAADTTPGSSWSAPPGMTEETQDDGTLVATGAADGPLYYSGPTGSQTAAFGSGTAPAQLVTVMFALRPAPPVFYYADQLGSTRVLADQAGNVIATETYDPFGNLAGATGGAGVNNTVLYAGQYRDAESGFYYLRARYYDPSTAQWLTRDPAASLTKTPYGYVGDNPLNGTDPSGLLPTNLPAWMMSLPCLSSILADSEQDVAGSFGIQGLYSILGIGTYAVGAFATLVGDTALAWGTTVAGAPGLLAGVLGFAQAVQKGDTLGAVLGGVGTALSVAAIVVGVSNPITALALGGAGLVAGLWSLFT